MEKRHDISEELKRLSHEYQVSLLNFHLTFQKPESESGSSLEVLDQNDIRDRPQGKTKQNPLSNH